ncbi:unnamed protein product, partial [Prorocentrum cordatum]
PPAQPGASGQRVRLLHHPAAGAAAGMHLPPVAHRRPARALEEGALQAGRVRHDPCALRPRPVRRARGERHAPRLLPLHGLRVRAVQHGRADRKFWPLLPVRQ